MTVVWPRPERHNSGMGKGAVTCWTTIEGAARGSVEDRDRFARTYLPIARAYRDAGTKVVSILGGRTDELVILRPEMEAVSEEVYYTTDDGSLGTKGLVTHALERYIEISGTPDLVVAIGPAVMMRAVAEMTRPLKIPTIVSLNTIMVDGTGMCGGCRVPVGGDSKFVCVDGPEFDGHQVDFDMLIKRQRIYLEQEEEARRRFLARHVCRADAASGG